MSGPDHAAPPQVTFAAAPVGGQALDLGPPDPGAERAYGVHVHALLGEGQRACLGLAVPGTGAHAAAALAGTGQALRCSGLWASPRGNLLVGQPLRGEPGGSTPPPGHNVLEWAGTERAGGVSALLAGLAAYGREAGGPARLTLELAQARRLMFALTVWQHSGEARLLGIAREELEHPRGAPGWAEAGLDPVALGARLAFPAESGGVRAPGREGLADLGCVTADAVLGAPEGASSAVVTEMPTNAAFQGPRALRVFRMGEALFVHWPLQVGKAGQPQDPEGGAWAVLATGRRLAGEITARHGAFLRSDGTVVIPDREWLPRAQAAHGAWQADPARAEDVAGILPQQPGGAHG